MMRLGIVGCGRVVEEAHAPALASLDGNAVVSALADPSAERRAAVAAVLPEGAGVRHYQSWAEMLRDGSLDVVVVALPHDLHERALLDAAAAGLDVISEKPLAPSLAEIDRIAAAVRDAGIRLSVMHNWQFNPDAAAALAAIRAGRIGVPFLVRNEAIWGAPWESKDPADPNWRLSHARSGGGAVIDSAYHAFYVSECEMLSRVVSVFAALGSFGGSEVDDTSAVVLTHASGGISVIERCWLARGGGSGAHEIHGSAGSIRFAQLDSRVMSHIFRGDYEAANEAARGLPASPPLELFENTIGEWRPIQLPPGPSNWWDGIREIYRDTLDRWARGEPAPVGLEAARHALAIVATCYLSAERGEAVEVAELEGERPNSLADR
jgi:predicted dehydrogenase